MGIGTFTREEEINNELAEKKERLEYLENNENTDEYDDMLDDCHEGVFNILPSTILKECDPIAYRCGLTDYNDEELSTLTDEIEELEEQLKEVVKE